MALFRCLTLLTACALTVTAADPPLSPPLRIERLNAPAIRLSQYRGKIVVLALISTSCPHCQDFTVALNHLAPRYSPRSVQFLECAFNENARAGLPEFLERFSPSFPVGYAAPAAVMAYLRRTAFDTTPLFVPQVKVLDRAGRIRAGYSARDAFFREAEGNLRKLLNSMLEPAAPATSASPSHR